MTGGQGDEADAEVIVFKTAHAPQGWAIVRLDSGAIQARREHSGNQQITTSFDPADLDRRLTGYGPRPIPVDHPRGQRATAN